MLDKKIASRSELRKLFELEAENLGLSTQVFSDGPINSTLAIIGEGPGEQEVRTGIPFAGGSGKVLLDEGRKYDIARHNSYITNVVKRQISLSSRENSRHAVNKAELARWTSLLHWELEQLPQLKYIFAMGNFALQALFGHAGITDWRGSVLDLTLNNGREVKVIIAFNPAYVIREPKFHPIFKMDMFKLSRVVSGKFKPHEIRSIINPDRKLISEYLLELSNAGNPTALDIETTAGQLACVGLSNDPHEAMCINFRDDKENRFSVREEAEILHEIRTLTRKVPIVAQNGIFDSYYSWLKSKLKFDVSFDTMLAHHLLYSQLPHSLAFLVAQYTTHPFYKDEGKLWQEGGDINVWWTYNCKDAALTIACARALSQSLEKRGLLDFFNNHIMRLQPHLVQATVHGVKCDVELKDRIRIELRQQVQEIRNEFDNLVMEACGDESYFVNPNSPTQVGELIFSRLRCKGRGFSTDATNRARIIADPRTSGMAKEVLTKLEQYKKEHKFLTTYAEMEIDHDARFRCTYKQHGVSRAPGRLSSAQTADRTGGNLQNIPERAYDMFVADHGCVFIYLDGSQAEARIVGWYYDIEKWKEDFERARIDKSYDCHRALAAQMFKLDYKDVPTKDIIDGEKTKRYVAKRCRHGLNYRMQPQRLAEVTGLPFHESRRAHSLYHQLTPELRRGWKKEEEKVRRRRELVNAYGRPLRFIQRIDESALESIIAFYPQSTMGDHVCRAWYMASEDDAWDSSKARIALNIHDALIGISTPSFAKRALKIMKKHMEAEIIITDLYERKTEKLIIPAECKISAPDEKGVHRWSGLKEIEL